MDTTTILALLKADLGVSHTMRDSYYNNMIEAAIKELEAKGIALDNSIEDQMLVSDYTAWQYRHRTEDVQLARNIDLRIKNRIVKARSES